MKVQIQSHASFISELLAAERRRTAAEIAEFVYDYIHDNKGLSHIDESDVFEVIIKEWKCGDHLQEDGYELGQGN